MTTNADATTPDGAERGEGLRVDREGLTGQNLRDVEEIAAYIRLTEGCGEGSPPLAMEALERLADRLRETPPEGAILRREVLALRRAVCAYEAGTTFDVDQETSEAIDRAFDWNNPELKADRRSREHELPELEAALRTPTPDPPSEGYKIEATVREKGLRPAIENGLYYWTDLDPHDDEAWVVDALVEAAREIVSAPPPVEGEAQAWFRATECNQPPVSVPHSEAAAHGAPICPSCSSVTCMVRTASPPVEEGERGERCTCPDDAGCEDCVNPNCPVHGDSPPAEGQGDVLTQEEVEHLTAWMTYTGGDFRPRAARESRRKVLASHRALLDEVRHLRAPQGEGGGGGNLHPDDLEEMADWLTKTGEAHDPGQPYEDRPAWVEIVEMLRSSASEIRRLRAPQGEVDTDDPRCPHCNSRVQVVSDDGKLYLAPDPAEHDGAPQGEDGGDGAG